MSRTRVLLSLCLSLFSQPSHIIWHSQFLCTARSPHSLRPHMTGISVPSTTRHRSLSVPHHWNHCGLNSELACFASPPIPVIPLLYSRCIISPITSIVSHPLWTALTSLPRLRLFLIFLGSFPPSPGIPYQLYILRTCVISPSIQSSPRIVPLNGGLG